jgi:hypothetical protein
VAARACIAMAALAAWASASDRASWSCACAPRSAACNSRCKFVTHMLDSRCTAGAWPLHGREICDTAVAQPVSRIRTQRCRYSAVITDVYGIYTGFLLDSYRIHNGFTPAHLQLERALFGRVHRTLRLGEAADRAARPINTHTRTAGYIHSKCRMLLFLTHPSQFTHPPTPPPSYPPILSLSHYPAFQSASAGRPPGRHLALPPTHTHAHTGYRVLLRVALASRSCRKVPAVG